MLPSTRTARRRMFRAGVLSRRWAADRANAPAAASTGATASEPACATYPVSTGNAPQAAAKPKSVCIAPPNSSALYAMTRTGPATMNGIRVQPTQYTPTTPRASAPARPTTTTATRADDGIRVRSGRPRSSSRACAASPTARKNASTVAIRRLVCTRGASAAPITA